LHSRDYTRTVSLARKSAYQSQSYPNQVHQDLSSKHPQEFHNLNTHQPQGMNTLPQLGTMPHVPLFTELQHPTQQQPLLPIIPHANLQQPNPFVTLPKTHTNNHIPNNIQIQQPLPLPPPQKNQPHPQPLQIQGEHPIPHQPWAPQL